MRVPIPLVLLLSIGLISGLWWAGTRRIDFMTPPSEVELAAVRARTIASVPQGDRPINAMSTPVAPPQPPPPPPQPPPKPVPEVGDLKRPVTISEYRDQASKGASYLIELAELLESKNEFSRALLAWERVIDSVRSDAKQHQVAVEAIKRLRPSMPDWNTDSKKACGIILHVGTGKKTAKLLKPVLEKMSREIEKASAGILKVTPEISVGKDIKSTSAQPPVALWLTGSAKKSRSTEVVAFTMTTPDALSDQVAATVLQIALGKVARAAASGVPAKDALSSHVTRQMWHDLGVRLNLAAE